MKTNSSKMHRMHTIQMPRGHANRLHPVHWLSTHPLLLALLITVLITLVVIGLARMINTGIHMDTLKRVDYQMYPYGGNY